MKNDDINKVLTGIINDLSYWQGKREDDYSIPLYAIPNIRNARNGIVRVASGKWGVLGNATRLYRKMEDDGLIMTYSDNGRISHIQLTDNGKNFINNSIQPIDELNKE